jgi:hypothetical protein
MQEQPERVLPPRRKPLDPVKTECKVQIEAISSVIEEIASVAVRHYSEIRFSKEAEYNPDWGRYLSYELTDSIVIVTARYEGVLVGYIAYIIGPYKHSQDTPFAAMDAIWISPAFREGMLAVKMMKAGEAALEGRAKFCLTNSTMKHPIDKLLTFMGYEPVEVMYYKPLGVEHGRRRSAKSAKESGEHSGHQRDVGPSEPEHRTGGEQPATDAGI